MKNTRYLTKKEIKVITRSIGPGALNQEEMNILRKLQQVSIQTVTVKKGKKLT